MAYTLWRMFATGETWMAACCVWLMACKLRASRTEADASFASLQLAVGILLAAGLSGDSLLKGVGVAIIVMFCLFALAFSS